ncbi:hypothetical protein Bresa_00252|uniref:Oxidoreductase subunit n=1 Tax=Brenneria salicis ATCC 15712 = DSM 30166 TaxID=714314 RepID=A0A366I5I8_9GAMM|nr:hypothetical protein [Brenneria salicis]NMN90201.1 hypothetical protein [Brenneria salicis ATCC 15712 = DSM 30166]RBP62175.1 hypothetical protein DES54_11846 [Brenneria salicis ATCC 15712 = DSM 30166]RLM31207.1 hypothetical protein BHG07_06780 [Brenneria salicis ATCC 15712 = DSM 30166]
MNKITRQQLHSLQVSPRIYRWFLRRFPQGGDYQAVHHALMCDGYIEWLESLVEYSYALSFDTPAFIAQEMQTTQTMVTQLTTGGNGIVQVNARCPVAKPAANPYGVQFATGDAALDIGCIGPHSQIALSGANNFMGNSGDGAGIASVGYAGQLVNAGFAVRISNSGSRCRIGNLGGRARISNSGNAAKISSGDDVSINMTGENAVLLSSGKVNTLILGKGGCAALSYHDGVRTRFLVVYEGENGIMAGVKYRINSAFALEADE